MGLYLFELCLLLTHIFSTYHIATTILLYSTGLQEGGKSGKSGPTSPSEGKSGKSGPTAPSEGKAGKLKTNCISSLNDICTGKSGKSGPTSPSEGKSGKSGPTSPSEGKSGKSGPTSPSEGKSGKKSGKLLCLCVRF